jgi:hypothetical protein
MDDENKIGDSFFDECKGYIKPTLDTYPSIFTKTIYK